MKRMKVLLFFVAGLAFGAELAGVHKVYLMPMPRGMDQYLATRIASEHVFEVVTDPKLADAVFTDRLGEGFENQLEEYSPSKTPEPAAKAAEPPAKPAETSSKGSDAAPSPLINFSDTANKVSNPALMSSFGRAKGTVFLVDAKSRAVVWATYDPPKGTSPKELDRTAGSIVARLKKDLSPKSK
jgi:hypothetical protein